MIRWNIDPRPNGQAALTLQDGATGDGFLVVFSNVGQLVETLEQIAGQAKGLKVLPLPTAFVKEFPELF